MEYRKCLKDHLAFQYGTLVSQRLKQSTKSKVVQTLSKLDMLGLLSLCSKNAKVSDFECSVQISIFSERYLCEHTQVPKKM